MTLGLLLNNDGPLLTLTPAGTSHFVGEPVAFSWSDIPVHVPVPLADSWSASTPSKPSKPSKPFNSTHVVQSTPDFSSSVSRLDCLVQLKKQTRRLPQKANKSDLKRQHCRPTSSTRKVSFSKFLEVREHAVTVGDHPYCDALPISLDWQHASSQSVALDTFEEQKQSHRRHGNQLRMSYSERKERIRQVTGLSDEDITNVERESKQMNGFRHVQTMASLDKLVLPFGS